MRLLFILNPNSGHLRKAGDLPGRIRTFLSREGLQGRLELTSHPGHAETLAAEAVASGGYDGVVAVGGDGTVNEIGRALLGSSTALGIIPLGSGNGLARELRIPLDADAAMEALLDARPRPIDAGLADGHPFFCATGTGFDAEVVHRFNQCRRRGFLIYLWVAGNLWLSYKPEPYRVTQDKRSGKHTTAFLIAVANGAQFGNNARIAPGARLDDARLNLVIVPPVSLLRALPLVWKLFRGTLDSAKGVTMATGNCFRIERARSGVLHVDGEVFPCPPSYEITILPASLKVLAPKD